MTRLKKLGVVLAVIGLGFLVAGGVAFTMVQDGAGSLEAFSEAQGVELTYNEDGQLIDRGTPEVAQEILTLLTVDWAYPIVESDLDPNDPLVNTASEYMYQMAAISYHTLYSTQTVVLDEASEYNGETFEAGTYEFEVDGRYWADFDRNHPLEGPARAQAWTGTAQALIAVLSVGAVTASTLQMGLALAGLFAGIGGTFVLTGLGMVWVANGKDEPDYESFLRTEAEKQQEQTV